MALIQCPKCGKQVSNRANNCIHCGASLSTPQPVTPQKPTYIPPAPIKPAEPKTPPPVEQPTYRPPVQQPPVQQSPVQQPQAYTAQPHHKLVCPKCGGDHLQISTEVKTVGKNYNVATGCLGWLIAGPIGLLCGLCGANKRTQNKTYWMCTTCGNSFKDEKTLREELKVLNTSMLLLFIMGGLIALICLIVGFVCLIDGDEGIAIGMLLSSAWGIGMCGLGCCYIKPRQNLINELKQNFGVDL